MYEELCSVPLCSPCDCCSLAEGEPIVQIGCAGLKGNIARHPSYLSQAGVALDTWSNESENLGDANSNTSSLGACFGPFTTTLLDVDKQRNS